jgi:hypothetical protein
MERLASQRHERFSHCFVLGWMRMNQGSHIFGSSFPVIDQLRFTN